MVLVKEKLVNDDISQCKLLAKCTCQGKLVIFSVYITKENLSRKTCQGKTCQGRTCQGKTCQGELASVYSQQVFLDKGTCQGKLASVNEA